jgi:hypothetical protein
MNSDQRDSIGELATEIDDLAVTVEEIQADLPPGVDATHLETVREALEKASDATDDLLTDHDH